MDFRKTIFFKVKVSIILQSEVRADKPSLTQPEDQRLKSDFRTTTIYSGFFKVMNNVQ